MSMKEQFADGPYRQSLDDTLSVLYGPDSVPAQKIRYEKLANAFAAAYGTSDDLFFFSSPGRVEIVGNHTDHNNGCVLAGTVDLDMIGAARKNGGDRIRIRSEGFPEIDLKLTDLDCRRSEHHTSAALVRGVAAALREQGRRIGGFDAYLSSGVPEGAGVSSSASFEIMIGTVINRLFNGSSISCEEIAQAGKIAETKYFNKRSGLMDQLTIAAGGIVFIDLKDPQRPVLERIPFRFDSIGLAVCLVDTQARHTELSDEYSRIPDDMFRVAEVLGKRAMREVSRRELLDNLPLVRGKCGDLAVLRAFHFLEENERVLAVAAAIKNSRKDEILKYINESGASSVLCLQNIYSGKRPDRQNVSVALHLAETILRGNGAWRVHGGGFGGTTFNLVPFELADSFASFMERAFGKGCCHFLRIRPAGSICIKGE